MHNYWSLSVNIFIESYTIFSLCDDMIGAPKSESAPRPVCSWALTWCIALWLSLPGGASQPTSESLYRSLMKKEKFKVTGDSKSWYLCKGSPLFETSVFGQRVVSYNIVQGRAERGVSVAATALSGLVGVYLLPGDNVGDFQFIFCCNNLITKI